MSTTIIRFEEPPPPAHPRYAPRSRDVAPNVAAELKGAKGDWALVKEFSEQRAGTARSAARVINQGTIPAYRPAGAFEAVTRTVDNQVRLYARYVGLGGAA